MLVARPLFFHYNTYSNHKELNVSKTTWIIFAAACAALLGGLVYFSSSERLDVNEVNTKQIQTASEQSGNIGDHVFGNKDSKVVLLEYGDFQCPGCGSAHPTVKELSEKYEDQMAFVFRNYPISSIHPNARAAAAAVEAAGKQGKYWEMHNIIFESQNNWSQLNSSERVEYFNGKARELNLDTAQFQTDMGSAEVTQKINFDLALGKKDNVSGTPTFLLNGEAVGQDTYNDPEKFEKAITDALKENDIELPKATEE